MRSDGRALAKLIPAERRHDRRRAPARAARVQGPRRHHGRRRRHSSGADLALLVRQKTADSDVVGVQRMDASTGALTDADRADAGRRVGRASPGFARTPRRPGPAASSRRWAARIDEPACADGHAPPCLVLYGKVDPDDATKTGGVRLRRRRRRPPPSSTAPTPTGSTSIAVTTCSSGAARPRRSATPAGGTPAPTSSTAARPGPVRRSRGVPTAARSRCTDRSRRCGIVNLADGTCDAPDPQKTFSIYQAQYAPAGDRMWWVSANDPQEQSFTLWLGGRQRRVAGRGCDRAEPGRGVLGRRAAPLHLAQRRVERRARLGGRDGVAPGREHPVVEPR